MLLYRKCTNWKRTEEWWWCPSPVFVLYSLSPASKRVQFFWEGIVWLSKSFLTCKEIQNFTNSTRSFLHKTDRDNDFRNKRRAVGMYVYSWGLFAHFKGTLSSEMFQIKPERLWPTYNCRFAKIQATPGPIRCTVCSVANCCKF